MQTREQKNQYNKEWREKNRTTILAKKRTYRKNNKEKIKEYYVKNKDKNAVKNKKYVRTMRGRYTRWKSAAANRKKKWSLTIEYLETLPMICAYTGEKLTFEQNKSNTASLDRVNNLKGYVEGNVVFCCARVNKMKSDMTVKEFKKWCKKIVNKDSV